MTDRVNLYYLIPESTPSNQWMHSNADLQDENEIVTFIKELENFKDSIRLESYTGYYDSENIANFLRDFEIIEDLYPKPAFQLLRRNMLSWYNWRDESKEKAERNYTLFGQRISNHTFCEVAEHQNQNENDNFVLLNHRGHICNSPIQIIVANTITIDIESVCNSGELFEWFAENRIPAREFQIIEKHGENRNMGRMWRGEWASPLRCDREEAFDLLKHAIGDSNKELFIRDRIRGQYYLIFKHEGNNPQNMYHGYHVDLDSDEVPPHIKNLLQ